MHEHKINAYDRCCNKCGKSALEIHAIKPVIKPLAMDEFEIHRLAGQAHLDAARAIGNMKPLKEFLRKGKG